MLYHFGKTPRRHNVPRVDKAVQMARRPLNMVARLVVAVEVEHVRDQVQCMLVVLHLGIEACQVEAVREVVLVNLAKVLIAST
jgi:hypothetical protein